MTFCISRISYNIEDSITLVLAVLTIHVDKILWEDIQNADRRGMPEGGEMMAWVGERLLLLALSVFI